MSGFVEFGVIPLVGALVFYFAMKWVIEYDPFYTGRPDLTRKEKRYYREQEEQIKLQELAVSIQQLESELLSVDFYTWLDALALVIDYQITGNVPTIWPGITRNPNTESSQLAAKIVQYFDIDNHLPMIDYGSSYGILFVGSYHELSSSRWQCQCGQPLGVQKIGSKEPIPGYQEHLNELKGVI